MTGPSGRFPPVSPVAPKNPRAPAEPALVRARSGGAPLRERCFRQIAARFADGSRHQPHRHEHREDPAADAEGEDRFERRRACDQGDKHCCERIQPRQSGAEGAHREDGADALGEALRRSGNRLCRNRQPRQEDPIDELCERRERGAGEHASDEPVCQECQQDNVRSRQVGDRDQHHAARDQTSGVLVDSVGIAEAIADHWRGNANACRAIPTTGFFRTLASLGAMVAGPQFTIRALYRFPTRSTRRFSW